MWPLSHWMICSANQMQVLTWTVDAYDYHDLALSSTKQQFMCFSSIFVEHPPPPYRCLILFAGFLLLKIQKTFLILSAVIRTAVNYCFHCKSIDSCHEDMALVKRVRFSLRGIILSWHCYMLAVTLRFFVWLFQFDYSLHVIYLQLVLTHSILVQHLSLSRFMLSVWLCFREGNHKQRCSYKVAYKTNAFFELEASYSSKRSWRCIAIHQNVCKDT